MKKLTFWTRFGGMFRTDFVEKIKNDSTGSWKFWWGSNTILAIIFMLSLGIVGHFFVRGWADQQLMQMPTDAAVMMTDAQLSTTGIPDPWVWTPGKNDDGPFIFVLDTAGDTYESNVLEGHDMGFLVSRDFFVKRENEVSWVPQTYAMLFQKMQEKNGEKNVSKSDLANWTITKSDVEQFLATKWWRVEVILGVIGLCVVWIFLAVLRLVSVVFWGGMLWSVGLIVRLRNWKFEHAFSVMQHWLLPLLLLDWVLLAGRVEQHWWGRGLLLVLMFGANVWQMRQGKNSEF